MSQTDPNADQIAAWNEATGQTWVKMNAGLDRQLEPIGAALLERASLHPGQKVLDIGCGAGATSRQAAAAVAPDGEVLGADVSEPLLALARERAAGVPNLQFVRADAQTHAFEPAGFDRAISRFGVMFFEDPTAAFANLRRACKPGARLCFACWRGAQENPWLTLPMRAAGHLLPPQAPADPDAPGPFAFADPRRLREIVPGAGWRELLIEPLDIAVGGGDLEETTALMVRVGPLGRAIREAGPTPELMGAVTDAVREALAPFIGPDARAAMPSASWIVTARA
jgi:SAM-dependent methyltransferase